MLKPYWKDNDDSILTERSSLYLSKLIIDIVLKRIHKSIKDLIGCICSSSYMMQFEIN